MLSAAGTERSRSTITLADSHRPCGRLNVQHPTFNAQGSTGLVILDLALTLGCGQVFHWRRDGDGWTGAIGDVAVRVEQRGDELLVTPGTEEIVRRYFALDHPLDEIYASFPSDDAMSAALEFCRGLRIVRQPAWECLATFITSAMKQVAHIAQISHLLRERYGNEIAPGAFSYPSAGRLASLSEDALRACKLGFRAKNLLGAARMVASGEVDLDRVATLPDDTARAELCRLPGVGEKVANCALLFGFGRLAAFPIDVWIERVLQQLYFRRKRNVTARRLREFSASYFGPFGGYAQQYLFHHARMMWPR
jgi:N-glycosylase/DNA lyase